MNEERTRELGAGIEQLFDLDDPPHKVWRAISIPEFREKWLPAEVLSDSDVVTVMPGREVRYQMCDDSPPYLLSTPTLTITPNATGGTCLRIIQKPSDASFDRMVRPAANNNGSPLMRL